MKLLRTLEVLTSENNSVKCSNILTNALFVRPKFSVVVVKKRIITRIFRSDQGRMENPPPGTIVDSMITKPEWLGNFNYKVTCLIVHV